MTTKDSRQQKAQEKDELAITRCMLLGCEFTYDDWGHPERVQARKYHRCVHDCHVVGYGHTQAEAAHDWLRRTGNSA